MIDTFRLLLSVEYRWGYEGDVNTGPRVKFTLQSGAKLIALRVTGIYGCAVHRQRRIVQRRIDLAIHLH